MSCPYCNGVMEDGFIKCSHFLRWGKEKSLVDSPDDVVLTKEQLKGVLVGTALPAQYCKACKKIIMTME